MYFTYLFNDNVSRLDYTASNDSNNELCRIWAESRPSVSYCPCICLECGETTKNLRQDSPSPDQDLNPGLTNTKQDAIQQQLTSFETTNLETTYYSK